MNEETDPGDSRPIYTNGKTNSGTHSQSSTVNSRATNGHASSRNGHQPHQQRNNSSSFGPADAMPFVDALGRNWKWLVLSSIFLAALAFAGGYALWKTKYTAVAQLLRFESPEAAEILQDRELGAETFSSLLRSPELLQRVATQAKPPIAINTLSKNMEITPERNSDVVSISITAKDRQAAVDLANLYARESVRFTRERQIQRAAEVSAFVAEQLKPIDAEIAALEESRQSATNTAPVVQRAAPMLPSPLLEKLQAARVELADRQSRFQDQHPSVREQLAKIESIEKQITQSAAMVSAAAPGAFAPELFAMNGSRMDTESLFLQSKLQSLETARLTLLGQKQGAETLQANPPGACQMLAPATPKEALTHKPTTKLAAVTLFAGAFGFCVVIMLVLLTEAMDSRLKTPADVTRVTKLPVVATAGDLSRMTDKERDHWAFRSWTSLQGLLSPSPNQGFVCGITSSEHGEEHGEGRSTWVRLLADAASHRGFRVLTIVAGEPAGEDKTPDVPLPAAFLENQKTDSPESLPGKEELLPATKESESPALASILNTPSEVTEKLMGPNPEPVVQIPLPGWVWNLERRKQWQAALHMWSEIDNIALLVELPPAEMPETVLLAENLPNLIWLADGRKATAAKTREQLETLRHARCHLAGAVLNRAGVSGFKNYFSRWVGCLALLLALSTSSVSAQELAVTNEPIDQTTAPANTNLSFSVVAPAQRAAWQQRLTLGPGDVLNISMYGEPLLTRLEMPVGPDGRIGFAEAQDIMAAGLTIDELRGKLDEELAKFRRAPKTMVTPVAFRSKKYFVLGRVMSKGVYILDRPTTVLEAVARARGFETGMVDRNIISVADFSRSFLMRGGRRIALNFEKLFQDGDLSQNLSIEPDDYIYFPPANVKEIHVVGEVRLPGSVSFTPGMTLMAAISARAGYTDRAYKGRVMVVRGSLNNPEVFTVETKDIMEGKAQDFLLQPKDIVFVNHRPFIRGEELLDLGVTAFLQSIVTATVGIHVQRPFQE
jgi:protein involved in polysaccharide export with SLBB domain/capsular polysaccharide biosynthesis protein